MRSFSISTKLLAMFLVIIAVVAGIFVMSSRKVYVSQLRQEAKTLAQYVIVFRGWVAGYGSVWVDDGGKTDYLHKREVGDVAFFAKNPALATRELAAKARSSETRASFMVTSDNYRNPKNKPDKFQAAAIAAFKKGKKGELKEMEAFEGKYYRYAIPLIVKPGCMKCHGDPKLAPAAVIEKYGDKMGFNYKVGDIRGAISVDVPTPSVFETTRQILGWWSYVAFAFAILLTFFFSREVIVKPIKNLTAVTEKLSRGDLNVELDTDDMDEIPKDEVAQLASSVGRLRKSVTILMDQD